MIKDLYDTLGVSKDATDGVIKKAFRGKIKQAHPDIKGGESKEATEVIHAYAVLCDPLKRAKYDNGEDPTVLTTVEQEAVAFLNNIFNTVVDKGDIEALKHLDLYKKIEQVIGLNVKEAQAKRKTLERTLKKLLEVESRMCKNTKLEILYGTIIDNKKKNVGVETKQTERAEEVFGKAIELLKGAKYTFDQAPVQNQQWGIFPGGGTASGW